MFTLLIILTSFIFSQDDCTNGRYMEEIFNVDVQYEIEYGENINETLLGTEYTQTLYMDVYTPQNDDLENRPLIFFMYGGSFIGGSKSSPDIGDWPMLPRIALTADSSVSRSIVVVVIGINFCE